MDHVQAVVPAAGEGTRLRPLTNDRPKGLVEVAGRPLLAHVFDALIQQAVRELVVVVNAEGAIEDCFGDDYRGVPISYTRQPDPRGLADAVLAAADSVDGDFLVANGDNVFGGDFSPVVDHHRATGADATLAVETVTEHEARETGVCVLDDGELVGVVEKPDDPPSTLALTGFFAFSPAIFRACRQITPSDRGEYELSDAIDHLLAAGHRVETVRLPGWRVNVNTPADIAAVEERLS